MRAGAMGVQITLSIALAVIFAVSAVPKIRHPKGFVVAVLAYHVLPPRLGRLYARLIPPLELLAAFLLASGTSLRIAAIIAASTLGTFIVAVGLNVVRGRDLDCHCFGRGVRRRIGWGLVLQDAALLAVSVFVGTMATSWVDAEPWSVFRLLGWSQAGAMIPPLACVMATTAAVVLLRHRLAWKGGALPA
ncbi:MAG: DoxX family protein [Chloroflexi bacterium]|nr:DoxX family protein [Chloroflexota bacterium]